MTKRNSKGQFVKVSKADRIRHLGTTGLSTAEIAKLLNVRYQQVRNTLAR